MEVISQYIHKIKCDRVYGIIRKDLIGVETLEQRQALVNRYVAIATKLAENEAKILWVMEEKHQKMVSDLSYHKDAFINGRCANEAEKVVSLLAIYQLTYKLKNAWIDCKMETYE